MAQDPDSIWVDWEAPISLPQGYLIEWALRPISNYSSKNWKMEPDGNITGILLEGEMGLGLRDGLRDKKGEQREWCMSRGSRGSWNLQGEAPPQPFLNPHGGNSSSPLASSCPCLPHSLLLF